jgi:hypothetical protein
VARDPGADAAYVSSRRVRSLEQVAGVQKRDPPLAATARSGVKSQQDDARVCAELVLVRRSKAAHSREHDADVQAPPHFRPVRTRHPLQSKAVMFEAASGEPPIDACLIKKPSFCGLTAGPAVRPRSPFFSSAVLSGRRAFVMWCLF